MPAFSRFASRRALDLRLVTGTVVVAALVAPASAAAWQESAYSQLNQRIAGAADGTIAWARGSADETRLVIVRPDNTQKVVTFPTPDAYIPVVAVNNEVVTVAWDTKPPQLRSGGVFTRTFRNDGTPVGGTRSVKRTGGRSSAGARVAWIAAAGRRTVLLLDGGLAAARTGSGTFGSARTTRTDTEDPERRFAVLPDGQALLASSKGGLIARLPATGSRWALHKDRGVRANPRLHAADDGSWALGGWSHRAGADDGSATAAGKASLLRTGKRGERLTRFAADREGGDPYDLPFKLRIALALPGSRGALVTTHSSDGRNPDDYVRIQIAKPAPGGKTTRTTALFDNLGDVYDAEASSSGQIGLLTIEAENVLAEHVRLVVRNADGQFSSTDLGPESSNPDRQFHLVRARGRLAVLKIEERFDGESTIEVSRLTP